MKTKYLLTALALPAMFAACSQEEFVTEANMPQSSELLGKVAGDVTFDLGVDSRLAWGATGNQTWEEGDEFSLFWVSSDVDRKGTNDSDGLTGSANALYITEDGKKFESKSIIYEGKHLLVYPVNKTHTKVQDVVVKVAAEQDGNIALGKRSVYTSDSLLTIMAPVADKEDERQGVIYAAGYNETVKATVKPLTSNLVLNLNFDMPSAISEVTVKKVIVETSNAVFATEGELNAVNDGVCFAAAGDKVNAMSVNLPANTVVTKNNNSYTAQIALLPIANDAEAGTYSIKVVTNYGVVTVKDGKYVKNNAGQYLIDESIEQTADEFNIEKPATDKSYALNLKPEFNLTSNLSDKITYRGKENSVDKSYGKRITANVTVKMSEASITNMEVANSQELIDAYTTYNLLGKTGTENFILSNEKPFELTQAAVEAILANEKVTLTQAGNDTIKLVGAHTSIPSLVTTDNEDLNYDASVTKLVLGEGTWVIDVDKAAEVNTWAEVINAGTLTISESNPDKNAVALTTPVTNWATVSFGTNVDMPVAYVQTENGTTTVETSIKVNLNKGGNISGTVDVDGKLAANYGLVTINKDAEIAVAGSLLTATTGTMHNLGTITLEGDGTTSVSTNESDDTVGSIVLANRSSQATVYNESKDGYIKWIWTEGGKYTSKTTDAFNCLVLKNSITLNEGVSSNIKHIEVAASKVRVNPQYDYVDVEIEKMETVIVDDNCTLVVPTGVKIATAATVLNGDIEVYGEYIEGERTGNGTIYYNNGSVNVATVEALNEAMENSNVAKITLEKDIEVSSLTLEAARIYSESNTDGTVVERSVVLDLNGYTLTNNDDDILYRVNEGITLTIEGEGKIVSNHYVASANTGGTIIVKGGDYTASTTCFQANGGKVYITGGTFDAYNESYLGKYTLNHSDAEKNNGLIEVSGGTFKNYNPAASKSENPVMSFVKSGYEVKAYNADGTPRSAGATTTAYTDSGAYTDGVTVYYKVVPVTATAE